VGDIGPIGRTVTGNIERLRKARGLSLRDLAERMAEAGRPTAWTVLHRQANGGRRVDVDDLVALAEILGVKPVALLDPDLAIELSVSYRES
jgi:transcriptional regulator with XRE-family HTH domain